MIALGSDAAGDVVYYNGTNYVRLAKGSDDEVLTLASGVPSWAAASGGGSSDEEIQDVVGAMFSSNTETGITVTYQDGDGTIDLAVGTLNQNTTGNAATATALETGRTINGTSFDGTGNITVTAAAGTVTGSTLNSGVTASSLTSVGTLTSIVIANAGNIGSASDTDAIAIASDGKVTFTQEVIAPSLDISGDVDVDGTLEADAYTVNGTTLEKYISDTAGISELLEETDGDNIIMDRSASGTDVGDDILLESGVDGGKDIDLSVLQSLTSDIIPQQNGKFNLGSPTRRFENLYLGSQTLDIGGAQISSDGSGQITISADGVTLPAGSKDADGMQLATVTTAGQTFRSVKLFTQASGLSTAAITFKFAAAMSNKTVYTEAGHVFTLSNGEAKTDTGIELFQF
jgi:hypothetical protein